MDLIEIGQSVNIKRTDGELKINLFYLKLSITIIIFYNIYFSLDDVHNFIYI